LLSSPDHDTSQSVSKNATSSACERTSGFIHTFPFIGMTMDGLATFLSQSFECFLTRLAVRIEE
jgi:hypothetical protein